MFQFELPIGGRSDDLAKKVHGIENLFSGIIKSHQGKPVQLTYSTGLKKSLVRICSGCESPNITMNLAKTALTALV